MSRSASYTHAHAHAHAHTLLTTGHAHAHACPPSTSNLLGKETRQYRRVMRVPGDSLRVEVDRWLKANVHSLSDTSVVTSGAWTFGKISWLISDLQPHERPMCSDLQPHVFPTFNPIYSVSYPGSPPVYTEGTYMDKSHFDPLAQTCKPIPLAADVEDDSYITSPSITNRGLKNNGMFCPIDFTMVRVMHTPDSAESRESSTDNTNSSFLLVSMMGVPELAPDVLFNVWCAAAAVDQIRYVT